MKNAAEAAHGGYAISTYAMKELPLEQAVQMMASRGWTAIEIMCEFAHREWVDWPLERVDALAEWGRAHGIRWSVHAPIEDVNPAEEDELLRARGLYVLRRCIERAERLGAAYVVVHPGAMDSGDDYAEDAWERAAAFLRELLDATAGCRAAIALENVPPYPGLLGTRVEELVRVVTAAGSPRLGLVYDVGHAHMLGGGYALQGLREAAPHLLGLHVSDNRGSADDHDAVGKGTVPLEALLAGLPELAAERHVMELCTLEDAELSAARVLELRSGQAVGV
ncbi:sugar phosphate isomerase/epimerase family protein [Paenibacillus mucilaginosus]|uniref:sugar phosphate isomerase/epimerase family protein n=1 Tax=Paenibacillus mucilaginosus TaxID=61624 RepID=UPI001EF0D3FB|nr:sugar phosphate isomerase/epimerase family protein [Paenibacillus mucilaginosus]MCG7215153.1 sugar phosphate isomerase/epimerase [Paenibacillus mucilaginosus]WDM27050.1 sugar phosphate isomerase/epimerase [Paenibacillus mucilaginosus]